MILSSLSLYPQARKNLLLGSFPKGLILVGVGLGLYIRNSFSKLSMWDLWFVPNNLPFKLKTTNLDLLLEAPSYRVMFERFFHIDHSPSPRFTFSTWLWYLLIGFLSPFQLPFSMILSSFGLYPQARKDLLLGSFPKDLILVGLGLRLGLYIRNSFSKLSMWDLWFVPNKIFVVPSTASGPCLARNILETFPSHPVLETLNW